MPKTKNPTISPVKKGRRARKEEAPVVAKRGPGRPRKVVVDSVKADLTAVSKIRMKGDKKAGKVVNLITSVKTAKDIKPKTAKEAPVVFNRRKSRVHNAELLKLDTDSNRISLPPTRVLEQLASMLDRADVQKFSGRRERPSLILSKLESQALEECKVLFELKLTMQKDGQLRRRRSE